MVRRKASKAMPVLVMDQGGNGFFGSIARGLGSGVRFVGKNKLISKGLGGASVLAQLHPKTQKLVPFLSVGGDVAGKLGLGKKRRKAGGAKRKRAIRT